MTNLHGDRELASRAARIFATQTPRLMRELKQGISERDSTKVVKYAHTLKGSLCNFTASGPTLVAGEMEKAGAEADYDRLSALLPELDREIDLLMIQLDELLLLSPARE